MKTACLFLIGFWLNGVAVFGQKENVLDTVVELLSPEMLYVENKSVGSVPDMIYWKGVAYLVDESLLSILEGYLTIYRKMPYEEGLRIDLYTSGSTFARNYTPLFLLYNNELYLRDIKFPSHPSNYYKPQGEYRLMERFTGRKFRKSSSSFAQLEPKESVLGSMRATWVTGVFYVKRARLPDEPFELFEDWRREPYYRLVFNQGRLIATDTIRAYIPKPEKKKIPFLDMKFEFY